MYIDIRPITIFRLASIARELIIDQHQQHIIFGSKPKYLDHNQYNLFRHIDSRLGSRTLFRFVTDIVYTLITRGD